MAGPYVGPMLEVLRAVCDHLERVTLEVKAQKDINRSAHCGSLYFIRLHEAIKTERFDCTRLCQETGCNYPEGECSGACGFPPITGEG